ncbi:MAG TPA: helix-turn-helix transcriptional regulator [Candidatus Eisenbacteria bacterium]|nr:helix-turn-helix transcriptional regulator [Candidatus Eisenbacteria bacterium]
MADNGERRPNERLRYQRRLRGWTLDEVAERLHGLAMTGPELGVDAHMVGRWERGVRRPAPRYVALLCQLFELPADELGLVEEAVETIETTDKEDDVRRRLFLQYLSVVTGATMLDWDRLAATLRGQLGPNDRVLVDDLEAITRSYARQVETVAPSSLLPALRSHLAVLTGSLHSGQPDAVRRRLLSLSGETALLAGRLSWLLDNRGEARRCWTLAADLGREAGDETLVASTLGMQRVFHSTIPNRGRYGSTDRALAVLDAAESRLSGTSSPYVRLMVLLSRAEDHAALGDADSSQRDLEAAEAALAGAAGPDDGLYALWDAARIAGYRGSCALALDRPEEASTVLESALSATSERLIGQRCAVVTDLATAYAMQREVEHSAALLMESVDTAERAGLGELLQRVHGARVHLSPLAATPAVRQLDERLALVG